MKYIETIIVGGGPAGSSCARELLRHGRECLVLERAAMPRLKLCAGWVTPKVLQDLNIDPKDYPHGIIALKELVLHVGKKPLFTIKRPTLQYSIRRVEFDYWLLQRSKAEVVTHNVRSIVYAKDRYIIDEQFECRNLVGAGGTGCPVARIFFGTQDGVPILVKEIEYETKSEDSGLIIWAPYAGIGYAWLVPKVGAVNVGYGGFASHLSPSNMGELWQQFTEILHTTGYLQGEIPKPAGWAYYLMPLKRRVLVKRNHAYITGDSAGLATIDMGEGIGPAVESGILAARDILGMEEYSSDKITKYSIAQMMGMNTFVSRSLRWVPKAINRWGLARLKSNKSPHRAPSSSPSRNLD